MTDIRRTYNTEKIMKAIGTYAEKIVGLDIHEWIDDPKNIALINEHGDVAMFENQVAMPNTVCGHYFFFSRGKKAVKAALNFLPEIFSDKYEVDTILGLTPLEHKGALWMNRKLGFVEHGDVHTVIGPCKFVMMTKQQWKDAISECNLRRQ